MSPLMKAINGMTMITLILMGIIGTIFCFVLLTTAFRDNNLYRFCGGLGVAWVVTALGRAAKSFIDDECDW